MTCTNLLFWWEFQFCQWQQQMAAKACTTIDPARLPHLTSNLGLAWLGLAWLGLAWLGLAWLGLAWLGLAWLGLAWLGLAWLGLAWLGQYKNTLIIFKIQLAKF